MSDCHVCRRHHPTPEGDCTDACRHRPATIGYLCAPQVGDEAHRAAATCYMTLLRNLSTIEATWALSAFGPVVAGRGARGSNERSLPGGTEWMNWRHGGEIIGCLQANAQAWHEMMDPITPFPAGYVSDLVQWLRQHLQTTGAYFEAIDETFSEVRDLANKGKLITGDVPPGFVMPCPGLVESCDRYIRINVNDLDHEVRCRGCDTLWTVGRLYVHAADRGGMADLEAIEAWTGVPRRTLQYWGRKRWVRRNAAGLYNFGDVKKVQRQRMVGELPQAVA